MRWRLVIMPIIVVAVGYGAWALSSISTKKPVTDDPKPLIESAGTATLEEILASDPVKFFSLSLDKYDKTIKSYSLLFDKKERIEGKDRKPEKCKVYFRESPFSVHMEWLEGGDSDALKVLYVDGENNGKLVGRSSNFLLAKLGAMEVEVDSAKARRAGRFTIAQFGFKKSTERTLASIQVAQKNGTLNLKYEGIVPVEKLKGQKCHKFVRTPYVPHEEDGLNDLTLYYSLDHWLQVGAILRDANGTLLGEYFFSDVIVNPDPPITKEQFSRSKV